MTAPDRGRRLPALSRSDRRARAEIGRRAPALVAVVVALAAVVGLGVVVDRRGPPGAPAAGAVTPADLAPVAPNAGALGSTWYCAAGTGVEAEDADAAGGLADHRLAIANPGDQPVSVVVTAIPGARLREPVAARPVTEELEVPPRSRAVVRLGDLVEAPFVAAIVEAGRGEVAVEHAVASGTDIGAASCGSSSSSTWYVAAGATTRDASEQLVLFNPFPGDAVVDLTFTTPDSVRAPPAFTGFIVPGRRVVVVDVGLVVSRHPNVSTSVVARSGQLVVERLQRFDGTDGPRGVDLTPAATAPALVWHLPDGLVGSGITETVTVYNPSDTTAEVDVEVALDQSADPLVQSAVDPFALSIPAGQFAQVAVHDDDRVPDGLGHALTVRSQNGVPVVAERWVRSGSPAPRTGFAATLGSPLVATRWLSAIGSTAQGQAEFLVIVNPDAGAIARVSITAPTESQELPIAGLEDIEIPAAGRVVLDLGQYVNRGGLVLVVTSTLPVVVERGEYPSSGGFAQTMLVPAAEAATIAEVDTGASSVAGG